MDSTQFKDFAKDMVEYVSNYLDNIRDRRVLPTVEPGYLRPLIPDSAPIKPEKWQDIKAEIERVIMPGITHWNSPRFHAYLPSGHSYPSIVADILSGAIACNGFTWIASPACIELEVVMLDWLGKMIGLPPAFLACSGGKGGGVIQSTASDATYVALFGAKAKALAEQKTAHPEWTDHDVCAKLVAYTSSERHYAVARAALVGGIKLRSLPTDGKQSLRGETLQAAIEEDRKAGLIPFLVMATLGTTASCAFDNLAELGPVANANHLWLHVDAAYAGAAFICPEFRHLLAGVERADSFVMNPHKWLLVNFDCSTMWLRDPNALVDALNDDPQYLRHERGATPEYRFWQLPFGRRFRALKLWFVLRLYGVERLQAHVRKHVAIARHFEALVRDDERFEVVGEVVLGLVCFRLRAAKAVNEALVKRLNGGGVIHLIPAQVGDSYFLRFAICSPYTEVEDVEASWREIKAAAVEVLKK